MAILYTESVQIVPPEETSENAQIAKVPQR